MLADRTDTAGDAPREAGADYLVKPIDHNLLIERLDRALNREELTS